MNNRRNDFIKCLAAPFFAFLVQQAVAIVWMELYMGYTLVTVDSDHLMDGLMDMTSSMMNPTALAWVSLAYAIICVIWFGVWYYRMKYNMPRENGTGPSVVRDKAVEVMDKQRGLFEGYSWTIIPGMILLACGGQYVCNFFAEFLGSLMPSWYECYEEIMKTMGMVDTETLGVPLLLYAIIFGPVCEELTFRGLCFSYARRSMGFWGANIISSLLFGLMHMNPLQAAYAILLGLVFGAIYEKSRNIFVTIAMHILFNLSAVVLDPFMTMGDTPFKFFTILLISLLVSYVGYELIIRAIPKHIDIEIR